MFDQRMSIRNFLNHYNFQVDIKRDASKLHKNKIKKRIQTNRLSNLSQESKSPIFDQRMSVRNFLNYYNSQVDINRNAY